jgi:hypothetical protein
MGHFHMEDHAHLAEGASIIDERALADLTARLQAKSGDQQPQQQTDDQANQDCNDCCP